MKLYDFKPAPNPRRVRIFLAEKGLQVPIVPVDFAAREQLSEDFRRINPECTVPVLQLDDGRYISDVFAICDYFENYQPQPALIGDSAENRAEILMWNGRIESAGFAGIAESYRNFAKGMVGRALPGPDNYEQIAELIERGTRRANAFYGRLDQHLAGRDFVAGDKFSIADITGMVSVDFAKNIKLDLPAQFSNLRRWYEGLAARPSATA
jgi:glutathione S-transferase